MELSTMKPHDVVMLDGVQVAELIARVYQEGAIDGYRQGHEHGYSDGWTDARELV